MDPKRYEQIQKEARKRIAARKAAQQKQAAQPNVVREEDDRAMVLFDTPEALMEALERDA